MRTVMMMMMVMMMMTMTKMMMVMMVMMVLQMQRAAEEEGRSKLEEFTKGLEAKMQGYRLTIIVITVVLFYPLTPGLWEISQSSGR